MEIAFDKERKLMSVWLTQAEHSDPTVQAALEPIYATCKLHKSHVAVFCSGKRDLQCSTQDLILHNRGILPTIKLIV